MKSQELIIYRNLQHRELFDHVSTLLAVGPDDKPGTMPDSYACASQLIDMAVTYGFEGNLWHCFLAFCLANNENVYSTSCEIVGHIEGAAPSTMPMHIWEPLTESTGQKTVI